MALRFSIKVALPPIQADKKRWREEIWKRSCKQMDLANRKIPLEDDVEILVRLYLTPGKSFIK